MRPFAVRRLRIPVEDVPGGGPGPRPTIVLVSNHAGVREEATRCLREAGYTVLPAAHSGHALLECLTASRVDVLVSELLMEETSGPALAQTIRRHHPGVRTVYFASPGARACDGVIVRPFTRDDLLHDVALAVSGATSPV